MGRPIPPPPNLRIHSASPSDGPPPRTRRGNPGDVPKRFADGTHSAGELEKGHVLPGEDGGPDRIVHSVTVDKDRVRVATQSGNALPIVETFPASFRFSPRL